MAEIRLARPQDRDALRAFFERLSPESRRQRFFSASLPRSELVATLCRSSDLHTCLTLLVTHTTENQPYIIAAGSYLAQDEQSAEVAFAVEEAFQGEGLGSLLLERLALLAVRHGFTRFWASTHADNRSMLDVFHKSGLLVEENVGEGRVEVGLSVVPTGATVAQLELLDRVSTMVSLRAFFQPRAVAVVGASRDPSSIGYRILEALVVNRFAGPVYAVNSSATLVGSLRAYPSVCDLPEPVDLAIVAVPRDAVPAVVDDCAARGVRALVVITAGYAEVGPEGHELQRRLVEQVRGHRMRMIGPSCMGLLNADPTVRLNASFSPNFPPPGRVAISAQSGALGLAILAAAHRFNLGCSTFVSVGNKADVSGNDLLQYWEEDTDTDVILLYLESFGNPRRFARIARRVGRRKPVVVLKSGQAKVGGRVAGSHTVALADTTMDAVFRQIGVIRAETLEEMFALALALGSQPLPRGRRVAVVTNSGGPGIFGADTHETRGLQLPELSAPMKARLAEFLPGAANVGNPIDISASATPEQYRRTVAAVLASGEVDAMIVIYFPVGLAKAEAVARAVGEGVAEARAAGAADRPVLACWMADEAAQARLELLGKKIPSCAFPEATFRVLAKVADYAEWRAEPLGVIPDFGDLDLPGAHKVCRKALAERGPGWLGAEEVRALLTTVGLPLLPGGVARTADEAVELARRAGFPVAVKLASRRPVEKTEVGGVCLNLADTDAVRHAYRAIRHRFEQLGQLDALEGIVVQPMVAGGVKVMVGVTHDPLFGPLIAFGMVHVGILADVCYRVTPLTDRDATAMVRSIRGSRLLEGYRGHPQADRAAIEEILLRASRLVEEVPEISELDLNPIFALPPGEGCRVVDARIHVR